MPADDEITEEEWARVVETARAEGFDVDDHVGHTLYRFGDRAECSCGAPVPVIDIDSRKEEATDGA